MKKTIMIVITILFSSHLFSQYNVSTNIDVGLNKINDSIAEIIYKFEIQNNDSISLYYPYISDNLHLKLFSKDSNIILLDYYINWIILEKNNSIFFSNLLCYVVNFSELPNIPFSFIEIKPNETKIIIIEFSNYLLLKQKIEIIVGSILLNYNQTIFINNKSNGPYELNKQNDILFDNKFIINNNFEITKEEINGFFYNEGGFTEYKEITSP